jgi:hypothetical protein
VEAPVDVGDSDVVWWMEKSVGAGEEIVEVLGGFEEYVEGVAGDDLLLKVAGVYLASADLTRMVEGS